MVIPKTVHYFEYAALRFVEAIVNITPRRVALVVGAIIGLALYKCGVYRKILLKNFEHVNLWDKNQTDKIIRKLYQNIGRYAVDFLRGSKRLPPYRLNCYDVYTEARAKCKGTIIVLAHIGNWELLAAIFGKQVDDINVIAKPMSNPLVEGWLLKKRTALSVKTIYTNRALREMFAVLRRNGITAILIDQYLGGMGTPTPFLGKTASTVRTVAGLVRKTGAAAVPIYALLTGDGSYDINFIKDEPAVYSDKETNEDAAISAIQTRHNDIISEWIIKHPEHWFGWFHRRFKGYVNY